jgi:hypothetical protein
MSETVFRTLSAPEPTQVSPTSTEAEPNIWATEEDLGESEPVEDYEKAVLKALGIDDEIRNITDEDKSYLSEASQYILGLVKNRGLAVTQRAFNRVMRDLRIEMGIDPEAEPDTVLNRIGGMVSAWRDIAFIKDEKERKSLFMRLARLSSSAEMNKFVLGEMDKRKVYR